MVTKDEVEAKIKQVKGVLFNFTTDNMEEFRKQIDEIDNKDSAFFKGNLLALTERLRAVDTTVRGNITRDKTKAFIIYHPALTYFARDYSLVQIPIEEEGREPSAAQLKDVISKGKEENVKVMFVQKEFANRNIDIIKKSLNVKAVPINPLSYHIDEEMMKISKLLK